MSTMGQWILWVGDGASDEAALDGRKEAVDLFADDCTGRLGWAGGAALTAEREPARDGVKSVPGFL